MTVQNHLQKYLGKWTDEHEKILVLKTNGQALVADFYADKNLVAVERELLGGAKSPSLSMKTYFEDSILIVELGEEGVGATLQLEYRNTGENEYFIPTVVHGLYNDLEEDFGVPWIFPLLVYRKMIA